MFFLTIITIIYTDIRDLYYAIQYSIINTKIDNNSYGVLNAIQFSLITNVSSNEISEFVYNTDSDYILTRIFNYIVSIDEFFQFLDANRFFRNIYSIMNFSCQNITQLNDETISLVKKTFDINLENFTETFCQTRPIMSFNSSLILQKEIGYLMLKLHSFPVVIEYKEKVNYFRFFFFI